MQSQDSAAVTKPQGAENAAQQLAQIIPRIEEQRVD